jgi:hypothetical protein
VQKMVQHLLHGLCYSQTWLIVTHHDEMKILARRRICWESLGHITFRII